MVQIIYTVFNENNELIYADNTLYDTKEKAENDLYSLYKTIRKDPKIRVKNYAIKELQFTKEKEIHKMWMI